MPAAIDPDGGAICGLSLGFCTSSEKIRAIEAPVKPEVPPKCRRFQDDRLGFDNRPEYDAAAHHESVKRRHVFRSQYGCTRPLHRAVKTR